MPNGFLVGVGLIPEVLTVDVHLLNNFNFNINYHRSSLVSLFFYHKSIYTQIVILQYIEFAC